MKWKSSNTKIATVSSKGKVKAKKTGKVTVTAQSKINPKVKAKCKVTVYKKTEKIQLNSAKSYTLEPGKSVTLKAAVTKPAKGAQPIQWSSKNSKVAKVTAKGKVTAVATGSTKVTGQSGNKKVTVTITVKNGNSENGSETTSESTGGNSETVGNSEQNSETGSSETETPEMPETIDTRAEWIAALTKRMGYSISEEDLTQENGVPVYSYTDISDDIHVLEIEAAVRHGILPALTDEEGNAPLFHPSDAVTREFAAMTAIRALGYVVDEEFKCSDSSSLEYPGEDALAVKLEMLQLKNGAFCPKDTVSGEELKNMLLIIGGVLA